MILTKNQAKVLENRREGTVDGGQKWSAAAKEFSVDPASKEQGGKLLGVSKGSRHLKFDAAIFAAVQGRVAGPVKTDAGYYVFRVTKVTKAFKQGLEQSSRASSSCWSRRSSRRRSQTLHELPQHLAQAHRLRRGVRDRRLP